jgi:hypothetical protein
MTKIDDQVRSFGMSGFMITEDIRIIEKQHNVLLGHALSAGPDSEETYYPQFEQTVRAEAAAMSRHYELFYCLENAIRKLIKDALQESTGAEWWESGKIPPNICTAVQERRQKEVDSGVTSRSDNPIDYTTFGELSVIIGSNWELFGTIFSSKRAVEKIMSSLNLLRGPIAHCCPITDDEVDRLELAVKDWFRLFG